MRGSCYFNRLLNVEIGVKNWTFVFFLVFSCLNLDLNEVQSTGKGCLNSKEIKVWNSLKGPPNEKLNYTKLTHKIWYSTQLQNSKTCWKWHDPCISKLPNTLAEVSMYFWRKNYLRNLLWQSLMLTLFTCSSTRIRICSLVHIGHDKTCLSKPWQFKVNVMWTAKTLNIYCY